MDKAISFEFERRNKVKTMYEPNQSLYALYMHVHNATKFFNSAEQQNQRSWGPNLDDTNPVLDYFKRNAF